MSSSESPPEKKMKAHYEIDRLPMKPVFLGALGLFALLALVMGVVWILLPLWTHHPWPQPGPPAPPSASARWNTQAPGVQFDPAMDLAQLRQAEYARLHAVRWTDASHTYATIPIEEAMKLLGEAAAQNRLDTLLPAPQPATPLDLQVQKSRAAAPPATTTPASPLPQP